MAAPVTLSPVGLVSSADETNQRVVKEEPRDDVHQTTRVDKAPKRKARKLKKKQPVEKKAADNEERPTKKR